MTKRKKIALILGSIAAVLLAFAALMIKGIYDYLDEVPEVTPISETMTFPTNTAITAEDLADIQKSTHTKLFVDNAEGAVPELCDDNTILNTGDLAGTFVVMIDATGTNSEHCEAKILITVTEETAS